MKILSERHNSTLESEEGRISELEHRSKKVSKLKRKSGGVGGKSGKKSRPEHPRSMEIKRRCQTIKRRQNL